jgi:hypothetical protein
MAATVEKLLLGSQTSLLTTGMDALANNGLAISAAFDNTIGQAGDGYTLCDVELVAGFHTSADNDASPTANTGIPVWFLQAADGSNYEDGGTGTTPAKLPDVVFPLRAATGLQRIVRRCALPWGPMKALAKNDGTGKALNNTGNTLKIRPVTREMV